MLHFAEKIDVIFVQICFNFTATSFNANESCASVEYFSSQALVLREICHFLLTYLSVSNDTKRDQKKMKKTMSWHQIAFVLCSSTSKSKRPLCMPGLGSTIELANCLECARRDHHDSNLVLLICLAAMSCKSSFQQLMKV